MSRRGSIPARAGEPGPASIRCASIDHGSIPARAGEPRRSPLQRGKSVEHGGLSPRVRGNPLRCPVWLTTLAGRQVYPRACGGTDLPHAPAHRGSGGSIPARAGEPSVSQDPAMMVMEGLSPRVRGNPTAAGGGLERVFRSAGLSPRVRGNLTIHPFARRADWHAGLSPRVRGNPSWTFDGEVSGVRGNRAKMLDFMPGLSPRVRGNPAKSPVLVGAIESGGSIPARAGEPPSVRQASIGHSKGLSPRVRGNPPQCGPWRVGGTILR